MKQLILASASPRRQKLLRQIGLDFKVIASHVKEHAQGKLPSDIVQELALNKAQSVADKLDFPKNTIIIGADTVVVKDGMILGKPQNEHDAFRMLSSLSGESHTVYTGVSLYIADCEGGVETLCHCEETTVFVRHMTDQEICDYIDTKEPFDKAGGYGIQGRFAAYISSIQGDYYNVVGLPLCYLWEQLEKYSNVIQ